MKAQKSRTEVYPDTNELITPGDILYSSKGWSTFLVGHCGIVGTDLAIYHSHPKGAFSDTLPGYFSRHKFGGSIIVMRPKIGGVQAANWAQNNIAKVSRYIFHPQLGNIHNNYCSKFIWQAFWFTDCGDISNRGLTVNHKSWIYPYNIKRSSMMDVKTRIEL